MDAVKPLLMRTAAPSAAVRKAEPAQSQTVRPVSAAKMPGGMPTFSALMKNLTKAGRPVKVKALLI